MTPFDDNGDLAVVRSRSLIEKHLDVGVHGFYVGGSSGEGFFKSVDERCDFLRFVAEVVSGRGLLIAQAKRFGATHTVNAGEVDAVEAIREITDGRGVDYAFEAVGLPAVMQQAYDCLAKRGVAMLVGIPPMTAEITVSPVSMLYEERVLTGSLYGSAAPKTDIPWMIGLYRGGGLKLDELLTHKYPIEEINEAYDALQSGETLRSVVTF